MTRVSRSPAETGPEQIASNNPVAMFANTLENRLQRAILSMPVFGFLDDTQNYLTIESEYIRDISRLRQCVASHNQEPHPF
jgi:hypothetical protein